MAAISHTRVIGYASNMVQYGAPLFEYAESTVTIPISVAIAGSASRTVAVFIAYGLQNFRGGYQVTVTDSKGNSYRQINPHKVDNQTAVRYGRILVGLAVGDLITVKLRALSENGLPYLGAINILYLMAEAREFGGWVNPLSEDHGEGLSNVEYTGPSPYTGLCFDSIDALNTDGPYMAVGAPCILTGLIFIAAGAPSYLSLSGGSISQEAPDPGVGGGVGAWTAGTRNDELLRQLYPIPDLPNTNSYLSLMVLIREFTAGYVIPAGTLEAFNFNFSIDIAALVASGYPTFRGANAMMMINAWFPSAETPPDPGGGDGSTWEGCINDAAFGVGGAEPTAGVGLKGGIAV